MRIHSLLAAALFLTIACVPGSTPAPPSGASPSPRANSEPTGSPASPTAAVAAGGPATCTGTLPAGGSLVLAELASEPQVVVLRDITDTANARTICKFGPKVRPQFVGPSVVAYLDGPSDANSQLDLIRLELATARASREATIVRGTGFGRFDFSPDGQAVSYVTATPSGLAWHLKRGGQDSVLTTLGPTFGRGVSQTEDDVMLRFSPDGRFIALVETFTGSGSGPETSPVQVRRASDGGLLYSAPAGTMGVWASMPSRLYFRDSAGVISRWDSEAGLTRMQAKVAWIRPRSSPDGRWVGYTVQQGSGPHVGLYSVQSDSLQPVAGPNLRSGMLLLSNALAFYGEEVLCGPTDQTCGMASTRPTGVTYVYDIAGAQESPSTLKSVIDTWPRISTGRGM